MKNGKTIVLFFVLMLISLGWTLLACNTNDRPVTTPAFVFTPGATNTPCGYPGNTCTPTFTFTSTFTSIPTPTNTATFTATSTMCGGIIGNSIPQNESGYSGGGNGDLYFEPITPASSITLMGIMVETWQGSSFEGAVYSNNAGAPYSLLAYTAPELAQAIGFNYASLNQNFRLTSGTTYWLMSHTTYQFYTSSGGSGGYYGPGPTSFGVLPSTLTAADFQGDNFLYGLYGVYCP
jgi:hypothetical protein